MKFLFGPSLVLIAALCGCGRQHGLYTDRKVAIAPPAASAAGAPRFVGRWASSASQCRDPVVLEARSLKAGGSDCNFDKIEPSLAGYAVVAVCHSAAGVTPSRLVIVTPNQPTISILTISGGPFKAPAPLQRCPAS